MHGKAFVKSRISALLLLSTLLVGCDATNPTGGDFLASQGYSIQERDTFSFSAASVISSVETAPVEGIPSPNGLAGLWAGGFAGDSVRAVVAFSLGAASGADGALQTIRASSDLKDAHPLSRLHFLLDTAGIQDTSLTARLRVRLLLVDSASASDRGRLAALLMGREPGDLGLSVLRDVDSTFGFGALQGIPLGSGLVDKVSKRLSDSTSHSWLVALVDGHPGGDILQVVNPLLRTDSIAGTYAPATFQGRAAWRSAHMRGRNASSSSLGWWVDGGRRLRVTLDAQALRTAFHARLGAGSVSDSFDNSYNVLQARARLPFTGFSKATNSADDRGIALAGAVVLDSHFLARALPGGGVVDLPVALGSKFRTFLGFTVDPFLRCDDTTFPSSGLIRCQYYQEGGVGALPTRLSLGYGSSYLYTSTDFWMRTDVPDSMEFRISGVVRVRLASSPQGLRMQWKYLANAPIADAQNGVDSVRPESRLRASNGSLVRQEIRSAVSLGVVQRKYSVELDVVPDGGSTSMRDLWEAVPVRGTVLDSLHLVVRPRGGSF